MWDIGGGKDCDFRLIQLLEQSVCGKIFAEHCWKTASDTELKYGPQHFDYIFYTIINHINNGKF